MTIIAFKDGVFDVVRVGVEDILYLFELKVFGLIFIIFLFVILVLEVDDFLTKIADLLAAKAGVVHTGRFIIGFDAMGEIVVDGGD